MLNAILQSASAVGSAFAGSPAAKLQLVEHLIVGGIGLSVVVLTAVPLLIARKPGAEARRERNRCPYCDALNVDGVPKGRGVASCTHCNAEFAVR